MFNPGRTHLTIFQQEGYSIPRSFSWWTKHPFTFSISSKKPLVITSKVRTLSLLGFLSFFLLCSLFLITRLYLLSTLSFLTLLLVPLFYLYIGLILLTPHEKWHRFQTKKAVRSFLDSHHQLTTIGITGSFGKTSVKDFLYAILSRYQSTVRTPESYNTVFGIAKVVQHEILSKTKFFLCEMGAYVRGEIAELCQMVNPDYGILTAIGSQHLERFKTLQNTTLAKFELLDAVKHQNALANLDNPLIKEHLKKGYQKVKTYSLLDPHADFFVTKYNLSAQGITFTLRYKKQQLTLSAPLFGTSNLYNLVAATSMALLLDVPETTIQEALASLTPSPHRLELKKMGRAVLIDNAFSSNEAGFTAILQDLKKLKGKKVIITPGIIELGAQTASVHHSLGKQASSVFDQFILVGRSDRTENFAEGIHRPQAITYLDNATNLWPIIEDLAQKYDWILLENDLPDSY